MKKVERRGSPENDDELDEPADQRSSVACVRL